MKSKHQVKIYVTGHTGNRQNTVRMNGNKWSKRMTELVNDASRNALILFPVKNIKPIEAEVNG